MPTYYEIYDNYSNEYDELVGREDYQNNLQTSLLSLFEWKDKTVIEAGIGTGRVTSKYISHVKSVYGLDRASHMLKKAKSNLINYSDKIILDICDNLQLNSINGIYDIFIEGWAFGHTISDNKNNIHRITEKLVNQALYLTKKAGMICFIETLGTNSFDPKPPNDILKCFYILLEENYGFKKKIIDTSYKFKDNGEAKRVMGFFFGKDMEKAIGDIKSNIIPEWTGIWYRYN